MLWLMVIVLVVGLSIVLFHKPQVKTMGAGWVPPEQRLPMAQPAPKAQGEVQTTAPAPQMPDTFNFNDLFAQKPQTPPNDRPNA